MDNTKQILVGKEVFTMIDATTFQVIDFDN